MFLEDVGTLFVVDQNSFLVGVVSRKDLLRASIGKQELTSASNQYYYDKNAEYYDVRNG